MRFEFKFYFSARSLVKFETIRNLGTPFRFRDGIGWKLKTSLKGKLKI